MGDRCFMEVWCLRENAPLFEELGFTEQPDAYWLRTDAQQTPDSAFVYMVDEEANYAHASNLPENVPYVAVFGSGSSYGPGEIVCDGERSVEVATGHEGGYVLNFDEAGTPDPRDIEHIRDFLELKRRVERELLKFPERGGGTGGSG